MSKVEQKLTVSLVLHSITKEDDKCADRLVSSDLGKYLEEQKHKVEDKKNQHLF